MKKTLEKPLIIAISSRALFDLDASHQVFVDQGVAAYAEYQIAHENQVLPKGAAFPLVKKLLALTHPETGVPLVEVILLSRNSADTGLRIFNSIQQYDLPITRAVFSSGESPYPYITAFGSHLFLSAHAEDVGDALAAGCAAATLLAPATLIQTTPELRIAFDGDAVLFSDESEQIFQREGLAAFADNEVRMAKQPLTGGPFKAFLQALHAIQTLFPAHTCPLRTALITARSAPAHERVIRTLRAWKIRIDEAVFLGGLDKNAFLKAFGADIFFDDHPKHCQAAEVATGHVPTGINNLKP